MSKLVLKFVDGEFTIHRLNADAEIPAGLVDQSFCWIARTDSELSIICRSSIEIADERNSTGWACLQVQGPLEFELTGILAGIAGVLARADVPIVALSTYDTDYLLIKSYQRELAAASLEAAGYTLNV